MSTGLGYWDCPGCGARVTLAWTVCACGTSLLAMPRSAALGALAAPSHHLGPGRGPKLPDPPASPRVTGKVLGFRCWTLAGYNLHSAIVDASWKIGENKARCLRGQPFACPPHDAPHPDCECGLYAFHELYAALSPPALYGAILAWGRIEVHRDGFRAQYAEPVVLSYSSEQRHCDVERIRAIGGEMGLPVVEFSELEARGRALGSPIAPELRPPSTPRLSTLASGGFLSASGGAPLPAYQWSTTTIKLPTPLPSRRLQRMNRFIALATGAAAGANLATFAFDGQHLVSLILGLLNAAIAVGFARRADR